jgi:hypothetical protein
MATADRRPARLGMMRLNAARLDVYNPFAYLAINGVDVNTKVRIEGATVTQQLNHAPDTASFRLSGMVPIAGQSIQLWVGAVSPDRQLFGGRIIEVVTLYEGEDSRLVAYDVNCIDPTWLVNRQKVLIRYTATSATAMVRDIVARFTRQITTFHVAENLPVLDEMTFTHEEPADAFTRIAERIGGYWYVDYNNDLHFFLDEGTSAGSITQANPRHSRNHVLTEDLSQVATFIVGRGGGSAAAIDAAPGQTELPVDEDRETWYATSGGGIVESGPQYLTYTEVRGRSGAGALAGIGAAPGASPVVGPRNGSSHVLGANYQYAITYMTSAGESLPGPTALINISGASPPTPVAPTMRAGYYQSDPNYRLANGGRYRWRLVATYDGGGRVVGPASQEYTVNDRWWELFVGHLNYSPAGYPYLESLGSGPNDPPVYRYELYRTTNGGGTYYFDGSFSAGLAAGSGYWQSTQFSDADIVNGPQIGSSTATMRSVTILSIPKGAGTVTGRKIYRTAANAAQLKLLQTVANNTDTGPYADTTADAALGANAPTFDTSGLGGTQEVAVGSSEIPVSSTQPFTDDGGASGGWAQVGNMTIRYSGIGTNKLTGIPPSGPGSITAAVRYGAQILVQPRLVGIPQSGGGAIVYPIKQGDAVVIRAQLVDLDACTAMAVRFNLTDPVDTEDGKIIEVFTDSRFGLKELTATITAMLTDRKTPVRAVSFETRDGTMELGRTVTLALTTPAISGTFRIRQVTFSEIAISGHRREWFPPPLRKIEATNKLYAFSDLVRRIRTAWTIGEL